MRVLAFAVYRASDGSIGLVNAYVLSPGTGLVLGALVVAAYRATAAPEPEAASPS